MPEMVTMSITDYDIEQQQQACVMHAYTVAHLGKVFETRLQELNGYEITPAVLREAAALCIRLADAIDAGILARAVHDMMLADREKALDHEGNDDAEPESSRPSADGITLQQSGDSEDYQRGYQHGWDSALSWKHDDDLMHRRNAGDPQT